MKTRILIGTYTEGGAHFPKDGVPESRGIYTAVFDTETGTLGNPELAATFDNPSFLAFHPSKPILYAVSETPIPGFEGGAVGVFRYDSVSGRLSSWNRFDSLGLAPCHLAVDPHGRFLLVSNYRGGNFVLFPIGDDGNLQPRTTRLQAAGSGPNRIRQEKSHAHSVGIDPKDGSLYLVDLGADTIYRRIFKPGEKNFEIVPSKPDLKPAPGAGCRHTAFSPDGNNLYVINELDSTVAVFRRDDEDGWGDSIQVVSTLPDEIATKTVDRLERRTDTKTHVNTASALCVHPTGRTVYASNRGHGSVTVFSVSETSGRLEMIQCFETASKMPRFCGLDPSGEYFFVCGQENASIEILRIDPASGRLESTDRHCAVDSPVFMLFVRLGL